MGRFDLVFDLVLDSDLLFDLVLVPDFFDWVFDFDLGFAGQFVLARTSESAGFTSLDFVFDLVLDSDLVFDLGLDLGRFDSVLDLVFASTCSSTWSSTGASSCSKTSVRLEVVARPVLGGLEPESKCTQYGAAKSPTHVFLQCQQES